MKKFIALVLSVVMICCFSITAFAADSPTATEKVTVTIRKADSSVKMDVEHTLGTGDEIIVKADESEFGAFKSWGIYKLAADSKAVEAINGVDYKIISGSLSDKELSIKLITSVIICANYGNVVTDPLSNSNVDGSDSAPATGDMTVAYAMVVMLAVAAFGFGVKKVYSK